MEKRLYRSQKDHVLAGVCGGIGEYFGIDSTIVRLLWIISVFVFDLGVVLYIIAAIIIPKREQENYFEDKEKEVNQDVNGESKQDINKEKSGKLLGYALIFLGVFLMLERFDVFRWIDFQIAFPVILILGGIMILINAFKK